MTVELLNDLRVASKWLSRPIDGKLVHMLAEEVMRLRDIVNDRQSEVNRFKPGLENEVARLTQVIKPLRNEFERVEKQLRVEHSKVEKQLRSEHAKVEKQLRSEYANIENQLHDEFVVMEKQHKIDIKVIEAEECYFDKLLPLLSLCADVNLEPQAAQIIRELLTPDVLDELDICLPAKPSEDVGKHWIQITSARISRLEKQIPHSLHYANDGIYLKRNNDGEDFAFRLLDGRNFVLRSVLECG